VARCLGWGRDGRRGARAGYLRCLNDSEHDGVQSGTGAVKRWRRKKGGCSTVGCSLYSRQRRWNESSAAVKPWLAKQWWWPWLGCRRCGLGADVWIVRLMSGPHAVSHFFELSKLAETCKVGKDILSCSKKFPFFT
jgi:hypothetical protein